MVDVFVSFLNMDGVVFFLLLMQIAAIFLFEQFESIKSGPETIVIILEWKVEYF